MFKAKKPGFIVIHNENLSFMLSDQRGTWQCMESLPLSNFLDTDICIELSNRKLGDYDFSLMIVPDFWFGSRTFDFKSSDKSAIESFIARKLKLEFPKHPEIQNLFSYNMLRDAKGSRELVSLYIQEPKAGDLCRNLARHNLRPVRITSPALLWNQRLKTCVDSFEETGTGLVYLLKDECFLLFYNRGNFLFSRTIPLPEAGGDNSSRYESLSFEINQSAYHYSQRTKSQLDKVLLITKAGDRIDQLREISGRNISFLYEDNSRITSDNDLTEQLGIAADFTPDELLPPQDLPGISDRLLVKEIEISKIQIAGIFIGLVLFLFLGIEFLYLRNIQQRETRVYRTAEEDPKQIIEQYNEALDVLLADSERKKPLPVIGRLAASLPENVMIESTEIELDSSHSISFKGTIIAKDINDFTSSLRSLVENLNKNFKPSNPMSIDDVEIEMAKKRTESGRQDYHISFTLDPA